MSIAEEAFEAECDVREHAVDAVGRAYIWHALKPDRPDYRRAWDTDKAGFVLMARGLARYIDSTRDNLSWFIADDGVLGPHVASILVSLRGLLDGELYGLDGGTLWTMLDDMARSAGWESLDAAGEYAK